MWPRGGWGEAQVREPATDASPKVVSGQPVSLRGYRLLVRLRHLRCLSDRLLATSSRPVAVTIAALDRLDDTIVERALCHGVYALPNVKAPAVESESDPQEKHLVADRPKYDDHL